MNPREDGITHINVYSKAATELGMFLSNFYPVDLEIGGEHYRSIEAYWYSLWASSVVTEAIEAGGAYRNLQAKVKASHGYQAKLLGKSLVKVAYGGEIPGDSEPNESFKKKILAAIRLKLLSDSKYLELFKASSLPFTHYYYFGTVDNPAIVNTGRNEWLLLGLEKLRFDLKGFK